MRIPVCVCACACVCVHMYTMLSVYMCMVFVSVFLMTLLELYNSGVGRRDRAGSKTPGNASICLFVGTGGELGLSVCIALGDLTSQGVPQHWLHPQPWGFPLHLHLTVLLPVPDHSCLLLGAATPPDPGEWGSPVFWFRFGFRQVLGG